MPEISEEEKEEYHWNEFASYAEGVGIGLDHYDDYIDWWNIWKEAIDVALNS